MPVPPKLLTSLGSAVHLFCPCLFLEMLQAALPSLSRPPACRLPQGRACPSAPILLSFATEAVANILWGWEMSSLPPPVCLSALTGSCGSRECSALCSRISYVRTWATQLEHPPGSPCVAQEASTRSVHESLQVQSQTPVHGVC